MLLLATLSLLPTPTHAQLVTSQGNQFGGDTAFDYDAIAFRNRVWKDGGVVVNMLYVDSCIKFYKQFNVWNAIISDYDANYGVKFTVSGNDSLVDKLYDLKGRYDMVGTTTTRPDLQKNVKNGKYSIYFDTTVSQVMNLSSAARVGIIYTQPYTITYFCKLKYSSARYAFDGKKGFNIGAFQILNSNIRNYAGTFVNYAIAPYINQWHLESFTYNGVTSKRIINGGTITTGLNSGTAGIFDGVGWSIGYSSSNGGWNNYFTKVLILQGDYATQAQWIHSFLNQRYNIY